MKDYKVFLGKRNETWRQALERFFRFREADMLEYFANKDYSYRFADNKAYNYYSLDKIPQEYFLEFTVQYNITVPDSLQDMLISNGGFRIGDSLLEVYADRQEERILFTLPQVLKLYGYDGILEKIGAGMLKSISGYYFFFGISFPESEEFEFLFFNKAGSFGKMLFAPHNEDLMIKKVFPSMFNGSIDKYSFDELISTQIDRVVINALTVRGYLEV